MSYCRWSSDNWKSDIYCYAHADGTWTTHIAGNRIVGTVPEVPSLSDDIEQEERIAARKAARAFLDNCKREPIGLPHDSETFKDEGPAQCRKRLLQLRAAGYHVPGYAIAELDNDIAEEARRREDRRKPKEPTP